MSLQSLGYVWGANGLTPEEKLLLIFIANNDGGLGQPYCFEWVGMGEFIGGTIDDSMRVAGQLRDKGYLVWGQEEDTAHWCWIAFDGEYGRPPDLNPEPKKRSKRVQLLLDRDGPGCRYCGDMPPAYHIDHFIPKCHGGPDVLANLVLACSPCNMAKGGQRPEQFLRDRPSLLSSIQSCLEVYREYD